MRWYELQPPSTMGHDAICADGRAVEIKATYGTKSVAVRPTSHDAAAALMLRLSRNAAVPHEIAYNGPFALAVEFVSPVRSNGQATISVHRLRQLNATVPETERVPLRGQPLLES